MYFKWVRGETFKGWKAMKGIWCFHPFSVVVGCYDAVWTFGLSGAYTHTIMKMSKFINYVERILAILAFTLNIILPQKCHAWKLKFMSISKPNVHFWKPPSCQKLFMSPMKCIYFEINVLRYFHWKSFWLNQPK